MINLRNEKTWIVGGGALAILLVAISWLMLISPKLSSASSLKAQTSDAQFQNVLLQSKTAKLRKIDSGALVESLRTARLALPVDSDLTTFTREVALDGATTGVAVKGISFGGPSSLSGGASTGESASGKLYSIAVTLVTDGTKDTNLAMLKALQYGGTRRALVTSVSMTAQSDDASSTSAAVEMTAQLQIFVAPQTPAAEALLQQQLAQKVGS